MHLSDAVRNPAFFSLLGIYSTEYEKASSIIASNIRKAICHIDEGLYLED